MGEGKPGNALPSKVLVLQLHSWLRMNRAVRIAYLDGDKERGEWHRELA